MLAHCAEGGMLVINPIIYADARRYRTYFPHLSLLAPEESE
jgi:hypothetical protein